MRAVIMAGGEGTRLRPLTCNLPKPMVPILHAPMMEHIVNLLKRHDFSRIACTLWYLPQDVMDYFQDGADLGVQMEYYVETTPLGTAGSVKSASQSFQETFLVVSGDALTDIDLTAAIQFHKSRKAVATLILTSVPNPLSYGVVLTNEDGRIRQFLEKPSWSQVFSDTVNTGIYILEPEVLNLVPPDKQVDFSRDVFPELLSSGAPLFGYVAPGYWSDVGSLDAYRQALQDCLDGKVYLDLPTTQFKGIYLAEGVKLHHNATLEGPIYLGKGSRVGAGAYLGPYTILGPYCQIDRGASLKQSILWSGVQVGAYSQLRGTICAQNVRLEPQVELYEGSVLGEKVQVGTMTTITPKTKVWPAKHIPSGTTLRSSLVWGSQEKAGLFSRDGIRGDFRGDLSPEIITQVGLSYASFLGSGQEVLVTSDFSTLGELAKEALMVGLRGGGVHVWDGGQVVGMLTRFIVQELGLAGALHCSSGSAKNNQVTIQCWNEQGRFFTKGEQRKVENIYLREDFPRLPQEELGKRLVAPDLRDSYLQNLATHYPAGYNQFPVGLLFKEGDALALMVEDFLKLAGYRVSTSDVLGLPTIVIEEGDWFFQDEQGMRLSDDGWWRIFVQAISERGQTEVALPVNLSRTVAQTAQGYGMNVSWTKLEPAFWMEMAAELGNTLQTDRGEVFPYIEPLVSIGELLSFVSAKKLPLSEWQTSNFQQQGQVVCPWESKGRIMRKLIQNSQPDQTIYLDGIKEHTESGWALVVPDGDDPVFSVYTEADNEAEATRLLEHYVELIKSYENEER